jgi:hypothetical protein
MYAISVRQPWAWALFRGKDVENRLWKTNYSGDLLIHASMKFDGDGLKWIKKHFPNLIPEFTEFRHGVIVGKVTMTDCVVAHSSPWFAGPYGHVYTNPIEFSKPIPFKGALKFFDVPDELIKENI